MFTGKSLLIVAVISLVTGFVVGFYSVQLNGGLSKEQAEKVKNFFPAVPEMRALSGVIKKIDGKMITLQVAESGNPFEEWSTMRKVTVTDTTKIVRISQTDPQKDPKQPQKEEIIKLTDLKTDDNITVEADHNIKNETSFTATRVSIGLGGPTAGFGGPPAGGVPGNLPTPPPPPAR